MFVCCTRRVLLSAWSRHNHVHTVFTLCRVVRGVFVPQGAEYIFPVKAKGTHLLVCVGAMENASSKRHSLRSENDAKQGNGRRKASGSASPGGYSNHTWMSVQSLCVLNGLQGTLLVVVCGDAHGCLVSGGCRYLSHPVEAAYFTSCIKLYTHMCLSRNYMCIREIEAMFPRAAVFKCMSGPLRRTCGALATTSHSPLIAPAFTRPRAELRRASSVRGLACRAVHRPQAAYQDTSGGAHARVEPAEHPALPSRGPSHDPPQQRRQGVVQESEQLRARVRGRPVPWLEHHLPSCCTRRIA